MRVYYFDPHKLSVVDAIFHKVVMGVDCATLINNDTGEQLAVKYINLLYIVEESLQKE